jgi:hypothetical protein
MVRPISLRLRSNEVTVRARRLLRRLDAEATAKRLFKHHAAKSFLAVSELRSALDKLAPEDRARWAAEVEHIKSSLLKISRGER